MVYFKKLTKPQCHRYGIDYSGKGYRAVRKGPSSGIPGDHLPKANYKPTENRLNFRYSHY
jgi:hypothetical protein